MGDLDEAVSLKKSLYAIRPLLALLWLRERDFAALPPMNIQRLMADLSLPEDVSVEIDRLLKKKRETRELGSGQLAPELGRFLRFHADEFAQFQSKGTRKDEERRLAAQTFYTRWVHKHDRA